MGPLGVVFPAEVFDDDPRFRERPQLLAVEAFVAEARAKRFDEAVLPRAGGRDVDCFDVLVGQPALEFLGDELRPVVGADELGSWWITLAKIPALRSKIPAAASRCFRRPDRMAAG